jgi:ribose transport system substrate-binding protein
MRRSGQLILAITGLLLLSALGCDGRYSSTICAIPRDPSESLYVTQHAGMAQAAARLGMKVYWNGPRGGDDTQQQIELMEHAIEQRDAGVVITPMAAFALDTVIQRALSERIPVVILGAAIPFPPDPNLSFVVNDIDRSARIAADRMCSGMRKPGEIAVIGVDPVTPGNSALANAFEHSISECQSVTRVVRKIGGTFTLGRSREMVIRLLSEHPDLEGIYSLGSPATLDAVAALEATHRTDSVRIVGTDPNLDLIPFLRHGSVDSLVFPNMRAMGEKSVENIVGLRKHLPIGSVTLFSPVLVTLENVDSASVRGLLNLEWRQVQ